jgi:hypothetical protein
MDENIREVSISCEAGNESLASTRGGKSIAYLSDL